MDEYRKSNQELWNAWTHINANSEFYDLEAFKRGKSSLHTLELEERKRPSTAQRARLSEGRADIRASVNSRSVSGG